MNSRPKMRKTCLLILIAFSTLLTAQTTPFDAREATISSVHDALFTQQNSCRDIVTAFLARIETYNPLINAIISLNPFALDDADRLDFLLASGNTTGFLFCVPILLKDNFDVAGIPTTAACAALKSSVPTQDSPAVTAFRNAGAIILGKTNLHELALEGLSLSSLGGQTINPYDFTRTPGGSSGGTGAAIAASFAVFGTGTDTVNSLRSPASANNLYSFRPTYGLISRAGVIPVSWTQDTIGALARCLYDLAISLTVMASTGYDARDNATERVPSAVKGLNYADALGTPSNLTGFRIGLLSGFHNYSTSPETDPVNVLMNTATSALKESGAEIVTIADPLYDSVLLSSRFDVWQLEYREMLTAYLSSSNLTGQQPKSMSDLYHSNMGTSNFVVIPTQYRYLQDALASSTTDLEYLFRLRGIANLTSRLSDTFAFNHLDAIIYPAQKNLVVPIGSPAQAGRNGVLAALTGSPVVTIPIGFSNATSTAPIGVPVGMEILGKPWSEFELLKIAKAVDSRLRARRAPGTGGPNEIAEPRMYESVPVVTPSGLSNIDTNIYPPGKFET